MLKPYFERSFGKDVKLAQKRNLNLSKLKEVVIALVEERTLPEKHRLHKLKGDYADCWECHIDPDWLLIYKLNKKELILIRTGSHSDLF